LFCNNTQHIIRIFKHLMVPKTNHLISLMLKPLSTLIIFLSGFYMLTTVYLNNQLCFKTYKVNNIIPHWLLSSEFISIQLSGSQIRPEPLFCICCFTA